jgi:hypothetical protein
MWPRQSDSDMHRAGFPAAPMRLFTLALNAEECTAHQGSKLAGVDRSNVAKKEKWDGNAVGKLPN